MIDDDNDLMIYMIKNDYIKDKHKLFKLNALHHTY
jgi:hypothetical protein